MKILIAIDGSDCSRAAEHFVARHFSPAGTAVEVLHIIDPANLPVSYAYAPAKSVKQEELNELAEGETLLKQAARKLSEAGFTVSTEVKTGDAKSAILKEAAKSGADLIVVGSHGRRGMDRFLLGSVSEAVARYAGCSVQIVRAPDSGKKREARKKKG
jgi:nucleotide-binding universal stress UspA family protein